MIELMIVIAIVSILTTVGYDSFTKARQQLAYSNAVERVVSLIQKTRNYAITSRVHVYDKTTDCKEDPVCEAGDWDKVVPSGYGINIQPVLPGGATIIIFVDNRYLGTAGTFDTETDIILESYQVSNDIAVTINASTDITIIFVPPFADVKMYKDGDPTSIDFTDATLGTDSNTAMIRLSSRLLPSNDTIYFNRFGSTPELQ